MAYNVYTCMVLSFIHYSTTDVRDKYNKTPLHWACGWGHKHVVQYLVEEAKCYVGEIYCALSRSLSILLFITD